MNDYFDFFLERVCNSFGLWILIHESLHQHSFALIDFVLGY